MTGLVDAEGLRDEMRECCTKQLDTRLVQMHGPVVLGSCDEAQLLKFIKVIAVRGEHKEAQGCLPGDAPAAWGVVPGICSEAEGQSRALSIWDKGT